MNDSQHIENLLQLAHLERDPGSDLLNLSGDGSDREFFRIALHGGGSCLAVFPGQSASAGDGLAEAASAYAIGKHLAQRGVAVPHILAYDAGVGGILFEDLGNTLLFDVVKSAPLFPMELYRSVLEHLADLQVKGKEGFDASFCWDTPVYDRQLMLCRESGYFLREFCTDYLGLENIASKLSGDFEKLADRIGQEDCRFLMHRDYQSRNIMIAEHGGLKIIDFQGARLGPLGYDVASVLNDPYTSLSGGQKDELLGYYVDCLARQIVVDREAFLRGYYHIALQRNLQVLGAYAFLSQKKHKVFFKEYMQPAFATLFHLLTNELSGEYEQLEQLLARIAENTMDL